MGEDYSARESLYTYTTSGSLRPDNKEQVKS